MISPMFRKTAIVLSGIIVAIVLLSTLERFTTKPRAMIQNTTSASKVWGVQIGSFSHSGGYNYIRTKLDEDGYRLYESPIEVGDQTFYRVWVGDFSDAEQASKASQFLNEHYLIHGFVTEVTHAN